MEPYPLLTLNDIALLYAAFGVGFCVGAYFALLIIRTPIHENH